MRKGADGQGVGIKKWGHATVADSHVSALAAAHWQFRSQRPPTPTYLAGILHIVLLSRLGADPGAGAGGALLCVTQDNGVLV